MNTMITGESDTARRRAAAWVAGCCLAIVAALVLGVGLATGLVLRHVVQTLPLWIAVGLAAGRSRVLAWFALPSFLFWLVLMMIIWLFLLGMADLVHGHFTPIEVAMTLVVAGAALVGVAHAARLWRSVPVPIAAGVFVLAAVLQWVCFRVSFLPGIVGR